MAAPIACVGKTVTTPSIRSHLLLLVLAVSIPLVAIVGYGIYNDMQQTIVHTKTSLRRVASMMVSNMGGRIANARQTLERLAARPLVKRLDPRNCDPWLMELHTVNSGYSNIVCTDPNGVAVCSTAPQSDDKPVDFGKAPWFQKFQKEKRFAVAPPHFDQVTGKWVSTLSAPISNDQQELVGAIHQQIDLSVYDPKIPAQFLPAGSRYGFFSQDGILIWRNLDPEGVIGTRPNVESARLITEIRDGELENTGVDGVLRVYSMMPMPETGWIAWVGVPASEFYAAAKRRAIVQAIAALITIALLFLIAIAIARRITRPVAELERTARAVHGGDLGVRAAVGGPRDIAAVAQEFNTMLDAQQRLDEQLRAFLEHSAVVAWLKGRAGTLRVYQR